ncbi:MAG TPA: hypothetical protein VGL91_22630 [Acidobacteriota bacterium]|jgi:hypothetical protein
MLTDSPPRDKALLAQFLESDRLSIIELPQDDRLHTIAKSIDFAMKGGTSAAVRYACAEFAAVASEFYAVRKPKLRVLEARPLRGREGRWATELFGDYAPETTLIRLWMRTAVRKQVTSLGTFLSTLCHEFSHHLDYERFGFADSPHTRGFYERTATLYHHTRGTPMKRLFWVRLPGGRWRIDWQRTSLGS